MGSLCPPLYKRRQTFCWQRYQKHFKQTRKYGLFFTKLRLSSKKAHNCYMKHPFLLVGDASHVASYEKCGGTPHPLNRFVKPLRQHHRKFRGWLNDQLFFYRESCSRNLKKVLAILCWREKHIDNYLIGRRIDEEKWHFSIMRNKISIIHDRLSGKVRTFAVWKRVRA